MGITVNTNMQALRIQGNLNKATKKMNTAMERMSSGYKINSAKDDAAGFAVSTTLNKTVSSTSIALDNVAIGDDLLTTASGALSVIQKNIERIRDLTEQAANETYSEDDLKGISSEIEARLEQIKSQAESTSFNGKKLLNGDCSTGIVLQVGTEAGETLNIGSKIFEPVDVSSLDDLTDTIKGAKADATSARLADIDTIVKNIVERQTDLGAASNRLEAVTSGLSVQKDSLTSALSTVRDADVAEESAAYVQQQILQSASATLLTQANSAPQIALTLIQG